VSTVRNLYIKVIELAATIETFKELVAYSLKTCANDFFFPQCFDSPIRAWASSIRRRFTSHFRHTTLGRTPLDERSARRRDLYMTTHNTHKRQTSMPKAGFEPTIPASERPQTHALDRTATAIGVLLISWLKYTLTYLIIIIIIINLKGLRLLASPVFKRYHPPIPG
jgi:hypothetical protein